MMSGKLADYLALIRFDKPIGTLLVLWPTLWGLWLATDGHPSFSYLLIFIVGTFLMRSAGCAINDFADRDFDRHVERTENRPLTSGRIKPWEALMVAAVLALVAFLLILPLNTFTKLLSFPALMVAIIYPFTKRFFAMPQAVLGIAFSFGIPMSFAAVQNEIPSYAWVLVLANIAWAIAYDTAYAMVDKNDDLKLGIKTSAITFGSYDVMAVLACYGLFFAGFAYIAISQNFSTIFWVFWLAGLGLVFHYFQLIRTHDRAKCFQAFLQNNWLGALFFIAIASSQN
jgi:4-hydroxybenzoate polyprenyltransferase